MDSDRDDLDLPKSLTNELFSVYRADVASSADVDRLVLNRAKAEFARRRRLRIWASVAAIAAVILLVISMIPAMFSTDHGSNWVGLIHNNQQLRGDVNGDGVVDIRDVLRLQKAIDTGMKGGIDVNGDGVLDHRDVDAIAQLAVRIEVAADGGALR